MTRDEIDPQYSDDIDLLVEESDEALEGTCGGLMRGFSTLAYGFVRTRLIYCDTQCFPREAVMAMPVIKGGARKVS
jgi:hypothetical protein